MRLLLSTNKKSACRTLVDLRPPRQGLIVLKNLRQAFDCIGAMAIAAMVLACLATHGHVHHLVPRSW